MLSDSRIAYFLEKTLKQITSSEFSELTDKYFKADKTDWFKTSNNIKLWDEKKVDEFWRLVRKYPISKYEDSTEDEYNFEEYIFPEFENPYSNEEGMSFWYRKDGFLNKAIFDKNINFSNCKFLGFTEFSLLNFKGEVNFDYIEFHGVTKISSTQFSEKCSFYRTSFYNYAFFDDLTFLESADFSEAIFYDQFSLDSSTFNRVCDFSEVQFVGKTTFDTCFFNRFCIFENTTFSKKEETIFKYIGKSRDEYYKILDKNVELVFHGNNFSNTIIFLEFSLNRCFFSSVNITEVQFKQCQWHETSRLKLRTEIVFIRIYGKSSEINLSPKEKESIYRQLKKNFYSTQDWDFSGKAYRSEMYEKQWAILSNAFKPSSESISKLSIRYLTHPFVSIIEFLLYSTYGVLSGYTQSIVKPIIWLLIFTLVLFPQAYNDCFEISEPVEYLSLLEVSVKNSLPLFKLECETTFYISLLQKVLSGTLISFFVLGLRKRFKQ